MRKIIRRVIFIIALAVLLFSSYKVFDYLYQEKQSEQVVGDIKDKHVAEADEGITVDFASICAEYPDVIAWIYQPGTNINYPIVQSHDNEYYLRRLLNGNYNVNGTLFVDYRNAPDFSDYTTLVYGHNMKNGEMFATFPNYREQAYFDAHPEMFLYTPSKSYKIRLFAGFLTDDTDGIYSFAADSGDAREVFRYAKEKSAFSSGIDTYNGERLAVLSTCSYEQSNARFVLVGILTENN